MKFAEQCTVREQCRRCPHIRRIEQMHDELEADQQEFIEQSMNGAATNGLVEIIVNRHGLSRDDAEEFVGSMAADIRTGMIELLESMDDELGAQRSTAEKFQLACEDGVLRLRAVRRGQQVVVTVCMSALAGLSEITNGFEVATVERTRIED